MKARWKEEFERGQQRDLSAKRYVCICAGRVYLQARMEPKQQCLRVLIGATPECEKELIALKNMGDESTAAWQLRLENIPARCLDQPKFIVEDGARCLEAAHAALWPEAPAQRWTVHMHKNLLARDQAHA